MLEEIRTERLVLRRARLADAAPMHAIMTNPTAMRYWSSLPHTELAQTETWMRSMVEADLDRSDDFIVTRDGRLIGKLGCWNLPEIGFLIDPADWGQGVASEALTAFLDRRRALRSSEITADVDPRNTASLKLLERHGFVETSRASGTWQIGDEVCDSIYLRLGLKCPPPAAHKAPACGP